MSQKTKKLMSIIAPFLSIIMASQEAISELQLVPFIYYPVLFKEEWIIVLIKLGSDVNAMNPTFTKKLDLWVQQIKISTQKINGSILEIFGMVIASFLIDYKVKKLSFFEETFLLANISIDIVLEMPFLILSKIEINFLEREPNWKLYTIINTLLTIK